MMASHTGSSLNLASEQLASFFSEFSGSLDERQGFNDIQIQRIASLLRQVQPGWSKVPRTYIVLRTIGQLDMLNELIAQGFSDHWFPVQPRSLPSDLSPSIRSRIVQAQRLILTKSLDLEKSDRGEHGNFARGEPLPFTIESKLNESVDAQSSAPSLWRT
jgi:hypothetical protein